MSPCWLLKTCDWRVVVLLASLPYMSNSLIMWSRWVVMRCIHTPGCVQQELERHDILLIRWLSSVTEKKISLCVLNHLHLIWLVWGCVPAGMQMPWKLVGMTKKAWAGMLSVAPNQHERYIPRGTRLCCCTTCATSYVSFADGEEEKCHPKLSSFQRPVPLM